MRVAAAFVQQPAQIDMRIEQHRVGRDRVLVRLHGSVGVFDFEGSTVGEVRLRACGGVYFFDHANRAVGVGFEREQVLP